MVGFTEVKNIFFKYITYSNCYEHYKLLKLNPQPQLFRELSLLKDLFKATKIKGLKEPILNILNKSC